MKKKRILAWLDSAVTGTGFGTVAKHILGTLYATGKYDIHHLAINFHGDFVDQKIIPWQQQPAKLLDHKDPHGLKMFVRTLAKGSYDFVFICNDLHVTNKVTEGVEQAKQHLLRTGKKIPVFIYYYPVDCHVPATSSSFLKVADIPVCYTDHGREETLKTYPAIKNKLKQISHGVNSTVYHPLSETLISQFKEKLGMSVDAPLIVNVNRNNPRKQLQYSFAAFKEFKKHVPNAVMYVHAKALDRGGDLTVAIKDLGLSPQTDIIYPLKYSPSNPVSEIGMNNIYNAADVFLSTHLGEGFGLSLIEAMAAGTPVVAPNNTCMPQLFGENSERGYLYDCKDITYIDDSGFRPKGLIPDIVDQMLMAYRDGNKFKNPKVQLAREWAVEHDWNKVNLEWIKLFEEAEFGKKTVAKVVGSSDLAVREI